MDSRELRDRINAINEMDFDDLGTAKKRPTNKGGQKKKRPPQNSAYRGTSRKKSKSRKRRRRRGGIDLFGKSPVAVIAAAAAVLLFAIGGVSYAIWYNSFTEVKLSECSNVTLTGYDEFGEAQLDIVGDDEHSQFFDTVSASLNLSENLSNGDELVITYDYDKDLAKDSKLRIDDSSATVIVSGLIESKHISHDELFSGLKVNFEGTAPCISINIENTASQAPISDIVYTAVGDKSFYDGGDEITICAQIPDEILSDHAYSFDLSENDYYETVSVPYGDRYFTDASQVSDEILSELEKVGFDLISQSDAKEYGLRIFQGEAKLKPVFVGNSTTFKWANPYVISAYFHSVTEEGKALLESHANDVQIVYGVTLTQADGTSVLTEMVIQFIDLLAHEDGTIDNGSESGRIVSVSYKDSNIKSLVNDEGNGTYITTKITD